MPESTEPRKIDKNDVPTDSTNPEINTDAEHTKIQAIRGKPQLFISVILLVLAVGLIFNGLLYVNGVYTLFPTYRYDFQFNGIDHFNKTRGYYSEISMESTAFAAHNPIHVTAKVLVYTNKTLEDGSFVMQSINPKDLPEVYVAFPRSHLNSQVRNEFPNPELGGSIVAAYGANGKPYWYGEADITYEMQGSYILGILSKPVDVSEGQTEVQSASFINIASEEVTSRMGTDRMIVSLTWAIMGLSLLTAIPVLSAILTAAEKHEDEKRKQKHRSKSQS